MLFLMVIMIDKYRLMLNILYIMVKTFNTSSTQKSKYCHNYVYTVKQKYIHLNVWPTIT